MKFELKGKRITKWLALAAMLGLCLALSGCYIPPDQITNGTENMMTGSNTLPFDPVMPTQAPTEVPTRVPTQVPTKEPESQPTFNWDDWGTGTVNTNTPAPAYTGSSGGSSIVVVTQKPTDTPAPGSSSLKVGSTGSQVRDVQRRLRELGYLTNSPDGDFGPTTEAAVIAFQLANGLTADGVVGSRTLEKLNSNNAVPYSGSGLPSGGSSSSGGGSSSTGNTSTRPTATPNVENVYLEVGSSGSKVRTLQNRLIALGWLAGKADGAYGGATQAAVKAFQEKSDLWADGVAGPETLKKLYSSSAKRSSTPVSSVGESLKLGMNGAAVRALQKRLKQLGYLSGTVDGDFGEATKAAVTAFQLNNGLTADGVAGTATLNKLYEENLVSNDDDDDNGSGNGGAGVSSTGYVTLRQGDSGEGVRKLQRALKDLGYYSGSVDGSYGTGTVNAVMAFQRTNNLRVDGVAGPQTQRVLYGTSASITYSTLREGDSGSAVRSMQYTLYELGYYDDDIDGVYGSTTKDAVRAFQIQNDLSPVDGVAGNKTLRKLYSSSARPAGAPASNFATLRPGDHGNAVVELQDALKQLGYLREITGEYDSATKAAVKLFQQCNGLTADGIAGSATQQKLYSSSAVANPNR